MEKIYTIPVNEAFSESAESPECGCPLCTIFNNLEDNELDLILGAAMMEPDTRIHRTLRDMQPWPRGDALFLENMDTDRGAVAADGAS